MRLDGGLLESVVLVPDAGPPRAGRRRGDPPWDRADYPVRSTATSRWCKVVHPGVAEPSEPLGELGDGDALDRVEIDGAAAGGTGSSVGSRMTSPRRLRIVVVQGAIRVRRRRGITASRERTTTGAATDVGELAPPDHYPAG
jgi:hypothetical protein